MQLLKTILIGLSISLLNSCSLFTTIPSKVVEGQKGAYQGLILIEESITQLLDIYERDHKAAITYHMNFIYQDRIISANQDGSLTPEERTMQVAALEAKRDSETKEIFLKIEDRRRVLASNVAPNIDATKRLLEAVYNYLSTTPVTIDNVDFWIKRLSNGSK